MAVMSVRIPDNEYKYATQFASFNGVSVGEYVRNLVEEKIEDFEDEKAIKELEKDMVVHPEDYETTYTLSEVAEELEF